MRSIWTWVAVVALSAVSIAMSGCSSNGQPAACGNGNSCQPTDLPCSRSCGQGQTRVCECGTGTMAGVLVCGECTTTGGGSGGRNGGATGGRNGGATGGRNGGATGGRTGGGNTGGASATGGRMGGGNTGGRMGGGNTGGASATGGRVGRGTGGDNGSTGGSQSSDAGTPSCPAGAEGGGVTCTATATPVCQTACVNSLYNICTCSSGNWLCPSNQLACP